MINVINTFNELFAFTEKEEHWFSMLAFIYLRAATPEQGSTGFSPLGLQRKSLVSYAEKLGLRHAFILEDIGSAYRAGRPPFKEMVEFYEKHTREGSCPALIVDSFDRLTRNIPDTVKIYDLIYRRSLKIYLVKENRVISKGRESLIS